MRRLLSLLLAGALSLLTACGPAAAPDVPPSPEPETPSPIPSVSPSPTPQQSPFGLAWDPEDTLDPLRGGATNRLLAPLVFEGLFALDDGFAPQPVLCQSYLQAEDGLSWTFTLRQNVTFSDGTPLTAAHAAHSLNAARTCDLYRARLAGVESVTAGEGTLTVRLSTPNGELPALLDLPIFLEGEEDSWPLGTGPYCFQGTADGLRLDAHRGWWQRTTLPFDTILLHQTPSTDDRIAAFDSGAVTLVDTDFTGTNALGYSDGYETWDYPTTTMLYLGFNTRSGPCADPVVRQAVAKGIDREELVRVRLAGHADPASLPVSPRSALYDQQSAQAFGYDFDGAARLLADGGYDLNDEGLLIQGYEPVALTLVVNSENSFRTGLAQALSDGLVELGFSVRLERLTWEDYLAALEAEEFDLYLGQIRMTADFDPTVLLEGELAYGGLQEEEEESLPEDLALRLSAFRAASGAARLTAAKALFRQLAQDVPFTAVSFMHGSVLTQWGALSALSPVQTDPYRGIEARIPG